MCFQLAADLSFKYKLIVKVSGICINTKDTKNKQKKNRILYSTFDHW